MKLRELHDEDKQNLGSWPAFRQLLGKCNTLHKIEKLNSSYTKNGKIKISFESENEEENTEINTEADLVVIFGTELRSSINRERKRKNTQK